MTSIPVLVCGGNMMPSSEPDTRSPSKPKIFGMEGPVISASRIAVLYPSLCMDTASIEVTRLLPTPPLPDTTPMTCLT